MTTTAPRTRLVDMLTGDVAHSGVSAVLDAADEISRQCTDADRLARDNEMLVRQNEALLCHVQELTTGLDEYAETIGDLKAELELTTGRLIAAKDDLESLRAERDSWRAGVSARRS